MTLEEMISKLDGAAGRLLFASTKDNEIKEALEMITEVSISLADIEEAKMYEYESDKNDCKKSKEEYLDFLLNIMCAGSSGTNNPEQETNDELESW